MTLHPLIPALLGSHERVTTTRDLIDKAGELAMANNGLINAVMKLPTDQQSQYLPTIEANRIACQKILDEVKAIQADKRLKNDTLMTDLKHSEIF